MAHPQWSADSCPARCAGHSHDYHRGRCVYCGAFILRITSQLVRARLRLRAITITRESAS